MFFYGFLGVWLFLGGSDDSAGDFLGSWSFDFLLGSVLKFLSFFLEFLCQDPSTLDVLVFARRLQKAAV